MSKRQSYVDLFLIIYTVLLVIFAVSLTWALSVIMHLGIGLTICTGFIVGLICFAVWIIMAASAYEANEELRLIKGNSRKVRREKHRLYKIQAQKEALEIRISNNKQIAQIKCEIKQIEREIKNDYTVCPKCKTKVATFSCFCQKCGSEIIK